LQLTEDAVVRLHTGTVYTVYMIGFLPGFPYMGPLSPALVLPRRERPRIRVAAGSVAIAGVQTGIYPQSSPGGWHLIGHTDFVLFDPNANPLVPFEPGSQVRFVAI
jgi:inhibitor of KinA